MKLKTREDNIYNSNNIITDNDINITNENHIGEELSHVIDEQDKRIERLESNVKWMYRYGALGSGGGSGSGSGSSTKWSVMVWYGGRPITPNNQITFSGEGYYSFKIEILGGGSDTYYITFSYYTADPKNPYKTESKIVSSAENFTWEPSFRMLGNNNFTITVRNSSWDYYKIDGKQELVYPYITSAYKLTANYVLGNNPLTTSLLETFKSSKNTILMSKIKSTGLMIGINYNIAIDLSDTATKIEYNDWQDKTIIIDNSAMHITYPDGHVEDDTSINLDKKLKSNTSGTIYLPLYEDIEGELPFLDNNENGSYKQVNIVVKSSLAGESDEIILGEFNFNDNLIPNGLFLNIRTDAGKLYNSAELASTAHPKNQITIGDIVFKVTPYNGQLDTTRPYNLTVNLYDIDEDLNKTLKKEYTAISLIDQKTSDVIVAFSDAGIKEIRFILTSLGETYDVSYYIYVKSFTSNFDWYPKKLDLTTGEVVDLEPQFSASYKRFEPIKNIDTEHTDIYISNDANIQMSANDMPRTIRFDYSNHEYIKSEPSNYDMFFSAGIQYYSINDTSKPILSINSLAQNGTSSTATNKYNHTIFVFQDKVAITRSNVTVDSSGNISSLSSDDVLIFIPLEDDYTPNKTSTEAEQNNDESFKPHAKYHMFNIYKRIENIDEDDNIHRSFATYIDGILEGTLKQYVTASVIYDSITLYPGNYTLNTLEYSLFEHTTNDTTDVTWLEDIDIDRYFKAYTEKIIYPSKEPYSENDRALFDEFSKFTYDENNRIIVSSESAANIAKYALCPVLVLNFADNEVGRINDNKFKIRNNDNFMSWFEESIKEGTPDTVKNVPVTLQYSDGKSKTLEIIKLPNSDGTSSNQPAEFSVDRQGSSTKTYRCKNLELNAPESRNEGHNYVYSPNMMLDTSDPEYTNSFLPEHSFTLKADVVDSSHTNNNAIGKFVNDNTTPFEGARYNNFQEGRNLVKNIKNCLIGFPILLFLNTSYPLYSGNTVIKTQENHYFLGIYNFNLGRNSFFNLGYKNIKPLENVIADLGNNAQDGFAIYEIESTQDVQMDSLVGGEIQGNSPRYDFSQHNDPKILFGTGTVEGMWGDFIGSQNTLINNEITNLCKETALAGGFAFTVVGKQMSSEPPYLDANNTIQNPSYEQYGYDTLYSKLTTIDGRQVKNNNGVMTPELGIGEKYVEWVPNYRYQATRTQVGSTIMYNYSEYKDSDGNPVYGTLDNLIDLIVPRVVNDGEEPHIPRVDYKSLSEYYTTMMAFGMVDSPMKNLNVKSWNYGQTFYLAFYDMDTGLGKNNAGTYINYFAFSDFWHSIYTKRTNSTEYQNAWTVSQTNIIRDYSPTTFVDDETGSSFFDVPSTYLFAVAKYAKSIFNRFGSLSDTAYKSVSDYDPSNLWGIWRQNEKNSNETGEGCLRNAKYFMETYFNKHLETIPQEAFNFNYRYKYHMKELTGFESLNHMKFHGKGNAYTEWWLDGRLHILDAYFNVNGVDDIINVWEGGEIISPATEQRYTPSNNDDVYMLSDAFTLKGGTSQYTPASAAEDGIFIRAKQYAPFIMQYTQTSERYLFPSDNRLIHIPLNFTGNVTAMFYGSKLWTEIESITPFIKQDNSFSISSKYISLIRGERRTCTSWTLNTPSLRTLILTSENYSGQLSFNESYQNLDEINISNTSIKLEVRNNPLRKLYVENMSDGTNLIALGLNKLEDVRISGGKFDDVQINSWSTTVSLPTSGTMLSETITVINDTSRFPEATLNISSNAILKTLNVTGFTHINVNSCPALETIYISDPAIVKTLNVNMPGYVDRYSDNTERIFKIGTEDNVIDLRRFTSLETIGFTNSIAKYIKLPDGDADNKRTIKLLPKALYNCKRFINFTNEVYNNLYITGEGTFYNCGVADAANGYKFVQNGTVNTMSNIYVDSECKTLKDTFNYLDNKGKITYDIASRFLTERCTDDSVANVTNIDNMFKNNIIEYDYYIKYYEYLNKYCSLPLWGFVNCVSANEIFTNNPGINFFNRYMFEEYKVDANDNRVIGRRLFNCLDYISLGSMCNSFSVGTIDMLYPFMNKLSLIDFKQQPLITIYKPEASASNPQYKSYDTLYINDLFVNYDDSIETGATEDVRPTHLAVIRNFSLSPTKQNTAIGSPRSQKYSFKGLFDNDKNDATKYVWTAAKNDGLTLANFMTATYTVKNFNAVDTDDNKGSYLNTLFCNIVPTYIVGSLGSFTSLDDPNEKLNVYTMFNWPLVKNRTTNLFCESYDGVASNIGASGINIDKKCTYDEFKEIWSNILDSTVLKAISSLFTNCIITNNTWTDVEFELSRTKTNESITTIPQLFYNTKLIAVQGDDEIVSPIDITSRIFRCMSGLKYVTSVFENAYMKHAIPFDVFGKRKKSSSEENCYVKIGDDYVSGKIVRYDYSATIENMSRAFYNVTFASRNDATFHNCDYNVYEKDYAYAVGDETTKYYEYYKNNINNEKVHYDVVQPTEIADILKLWIDDKSVSLIDTHDMVNDSLVPNVYKSPQIEWGTAENSNRSVKDYSKIIRPYNNLKNFCDVEDCGFVVSPDIFRCCSRGCNISNSISFVRNNEDLDPIIMTGMIPPSLFDVNNRNIANIDFSGIFYGLNILPIQLPYNDSDNIKVVSKNGYDKTCVRHNTYYQYILDNFTTREKLSECFNFTLLLPSSKSTIVNTGNGDEYESARESQHFIMFGEKSFSPTISLMSKSLPIDHGQILGDNDEQFMHEFYMADNGIYFNITRKFATRLVEENGGIREVLEYAIGIDKNVFTNLMLDGIINSDIAKILEGNVVLSTIPWRFNFVTRGSTVFFQAGGNNTGYIGLSSNARIQATYANDGWFPSSAIGSTQGIQGYNISKSSLPEGFNYDLWTNNWQNYTAWNLEYRYV